jgi:hypothetical protein
MQINSDFILKIKWILTEIYKFIYTNILNIKIHYEYN